MDKEGIMKNSGESTEPGYSRWQFTGLVAAIPVFIIFLLLPRPEGMSPEAQRTAAVGMLMVILWITEAIPIPATALLPLALFPMLKIMPVGEVSVSYGDKNIFLFMGGFFMAVTMQKWNLHRRIALKIINFLGSSPRQVILGFMVATAFLSMWISNTATTMMMLPIGLAIIYQFEQFWAKDNSAGLSDFRQALMLAIAFSASIGGIATLIGTPPNIIFVASLKKIFPDAPEISFMKWFMTCLPLVIVFLPITWIYLTRFAFKVEKQKLAIGDETLRHELEKLGTMDKGEKLTLIYFIIMALGWIFRRDLNIGFVHLPGWSNLLGVSQYVHDATVAMFVSMLLFLTPVNRKKGVFLLDWKTAVKIPWGILILFGGGIALADGFGKTKLAHWIAGKLVILHSFPFVLMLFIVALLMILLTEVTSNTAVATIFMPILAATAIAMNVNPIVFMMVGTIASSLAFMLPVATPPNAIVFGSGYIKIPTMVRVGFGLDVVGIILVLIVVYTIAAAVFQLDFGMMPVWAH